MRQIIILFLLFVSSLSIVTAADSFVYEASKISASSSVFDPLFVIARHTAGSDSAEARTLRVPLGADLLSMIDVPTSDMLDSALSALSGTSRQDGQAFVDGDVVIEFLVTADSYSVALVFAPTVQYQGAVYPAGSLLVSNDGDVNFFAPSSADNFPSILYLSDTLRDQLAKQLPEEDIPEIGSFVVGLVSMISDRQSLNLSSVAVAGEAIQLLAQAVTTNIRGFSIHNIRLLALMNLEERAESWLNGQIPWDKSNCFTFEGDCHPQGYLGDAIGEGPSHGFTGTLLGVDVIRNRFIAYVGFTSRDGVRYFVPFNLGSYDVPNGFGIIFHDVPVIGLMGHISGFSPWRDGIRIDDALVSYVGSPVLAFVPTSMPDNIPDDAIKLFEVAINEREAQYPAANAFIQYVFSGAKQSTDGPWYLNTFVTDTTPISEIVMLTSITVSKYV